MAHIDQESLQRYLSGEEMPEAVTAHLAECQACADRLTALAVEDDWLRDSQAPDAQDLAWIASVDLRPAVLREITPFHRTPTGLLTLLVLLLLAGWLGEQVLAGAPSVASPFALAIRLPRLLYSLGLFLAEGGALSAVWPLFAIGGGLYLYMQRRITHA